MINRNKPVETKEQKQESKRQRKRGKKEVIDEEEKTASPVREVKNEVMREESTTIGTQEGPESTQQIDKGHSEEQDQIDDIDEAVINVEQSEALEEAVQDQRANQSDKETEIQDEEDSLNHTKEAMAIQNEVIDENKVEVEEATIEEVEVLNAPIEEQTAKEEVKHPNETTDSSGFKTIALSDRIFDDFLVVDESNSKLFEHVAYHCMILVFEQVKDDNWVLEFPTCIGSEGRNLLHDIADYFGLAIHSQGKSGKNRRSVVYPRSQNKDKQETERRRLEKERAKLKEKEAKGEKIPDDVRIKMVDKEEFIPTNALEFLDYTAPLVEKKKQELATEEHTEYV